MINISELKEQLEEAARLMDEGDVIHRRMGENLWFAVCRDMLKKIEELEQQIKNLVEVKK